jgi:hypothetical protein
MNSIFEGGFFLLVATVSVGGLYELRLYTDDERAKARRLFQMHGLLWLLTLGISLGGVACVLTGHLGTTLGAGLYYVLIGLSVGGCFLGRRLHRVLDLDRGPLGQRFEEWWRHPSKE